MDVDDTIIIIGGILLACSFLLKRTMKIKSCRRFKTRLINRRHTHCFYRSYFLPMKANDEDQFFKYTRMTVPMFEKLLFMVTPYLTKRKKLPDSINPEERLAITLHYFSQGTSMQTIAWTYNIGHSTAHYIIKETGRMLWDVLSPAYLKAPSTQNDWRRISSGFETVWNFPNCLGALDGKHVVIQAPAKSGSLYFNYKKTFSVVLLACCDHNYNFTLIDIGAYGSESDGGVFRNSVFGNMLEEDRVNVPPPRKLPLSNIALVADGAFPSKTYILRPYPGKHLTADKRIFNYRLSRARRTIENTFWILVNRWRLLRNMVTAKVENIDIFVKAIVCLHNFVKLESVATDDTSYCPPRFVDSDGHLGTWRDDIEPLQFVGRLSSNRAAQLLYKMGDTLKIFSSPNGKIPWQEKVLEEGLNVIKL